jgi:hypothetical protein
LKKDVPCESESISEIMNVEEIVILAEVQSCLLAKLMETREDLLSKLIHFTAPVEELGKKLSAFEWDSEDYLVTLTRIQISEVIKQFLNKKITAEELVEWANAVEMRDDIEYEPGHEKIIASSLFELSIPEINFPINEENLKKMNAAY